MISRALQAEILRLHHSEGWPIGTIARQLRVHLGAVRHFIDAHAHAAGLRPPIAVSLPSDARLQRLSVHTQPLSDYDRLTQDGPEYDDPDNPPPAQP